MYDASLVASGAVTIAELNLTFVRKLLEVDHVSFICNQQNIEEDKKKREA